MAKKKTDGEKNRVGRPSGPAKYTVEFITSELKAMIEELLENEETIYLGELFLTRNYSMQRFSEWASAHENCQDISEAIKKIKDILLTRLNTGALKGKLNPAMTIFNLKNNYKWVDKTEQSVTQETVVKHEIPPELLEMIKP